MFALAAIPKCFGFGQEYVKGLVFKDKILGREVDKGSWVMLFNERMELCVGEKKREVKDRTLQIYQTKI
jgi:hypothetical protein